MYIPLLWNVLYFLNTQAYLFEKDLILTYSSPNSSDSEQFHKLSLICLITWFPFSTYCILLKVFVDNSFHLFEEQSLSWLLESSMVRVHFRNFLNIKICTFITIRLDRFAIKFFYSISDDFIRNSIIFFQ